MVYASSQLALSVTALGCGLIAAVTDISRQRIPNWLTGPAMLAGLVMHLCIGGWRDMLTSLTALALCGGVFLVFHLAGGMGAGDVKLIAAEGCLLGLSNAGMLLTCTVLCGGVLALSLAILCGRLGQTIRNVLALTAHHGRHGLRPHPEMNVLNNSTLRLPYALAIAAGCGATIFLQTSLGIA